MILSLYLLVVVLAAGATYAYVVLEQGVPFNTTIAAALWALASIEGGNIVIHDQSNSTITVTEPAFQYMAAGLAILSFGAFVLWYFEMYPVPDAYDDPMDPDQEARA